MYASLIIAASSLLNGHVTDVGRALAEATDTSAPPSARVAVGHFATTD